MGMFTANLTRMLRAKWFWLGAAVSAAWAGYRMYHIRRWNAQGNDTPLDGELLLYAFVLFVMLPILCSLFVHTDYQGGTIRNKLVVGHTRLGVYMGNFLAIYVLCLFYTALHLAVCLIAGAGIKIVTPHLVLQRLGLLQLTFLALTALSVFLAMLVRGRWVLILSALLGLGLLFTAWLVNVNMTNPETNADTSLAVGYDQYTLPDGTEYYYEVDKDGNKIDYEKLPRVPNPNYIREPWRGILRKYNDTQPGGQVMECLNVGHWEFDAEAQDLVRRVTPAWELAVNALALTLVFTGAGLWLFRRKDLK